MERRAASHTEEEEMNLRRRLLNQARKGDPKAINRLFELYQVRVYSGDKLKKLGRLPSPPTSSTQGRRGQASKSSMGSTLPAVRGRPVAKPTSRKALHKKTDRKAFPVKGAKKQTRRPAHR